MRIDIGDKSKFSETIKELLDFDVMEKRVNGISIDSRNLQNGDVFIAMKGDNIDSHNFINSKMESQTSLIINEVKSSKNIIKVDSSKDILKKIAKRYREKMKCKVIGITGSNGKTTTKEILHHILKSKYCTGMTVGNHNSTIGMPMSFFSISTSNDIFIAEMGTNSIGEIKYLSEVAQPDVGVITNISEAHIQNFNSVNDIYNEKNELFKSLKKGGIAFINMDDPYISTTRLSSNIKIIRYGFQNRFEYFGDINNSEEGSFFINDYKIETKHSSINLMKNILVAFSIASELGITLKEFNQNISSFNIPNGRGKIIYKNKYLIIDDTYNSNFTSTVSGICSLKNKEYNNMRKVIVLGDMLELGQRANKFHENLLEHIIESKIDKVFLYGDLMKSLHEKARDVVGLSVNHFTTQELLIKNLNNLICKNDVIYIKGSRGMKMERIIKGLK